MRRQFSLHVVPRPDGSYGVELPERVNGGPPGGRAVVRAWGPPLYAAMDQVLEALRRSGHRPVDLHRGRKAPFLLRDEWGVRVALLLMALKPLRKTSRMEHIAQAVAEMSDEECYYWFSKCGKTDGPSRGQPALRILLAHR